VQSRVHNIGDGVVVEIDLEWHPVAHDKSVLSRKGNDWLRLERKISCKNAMGNKVIATVLTSGNAEWKTRVSRMLYRRLIMATVQDCEMISFVLKIEARKEKSEKDLDFRVQYSYLYRMQRDNLTSFCNLRFQVLLCR
jgi:hypothetical protein